MAATSCVLNRFAGAWLDFGEINNGLGHMVDIVRQDIERDVGHRLHDFRVGQVRSAGRLELVVAKFSALDDDAARESEDGGGSSVGRRGFAGGTDLACLQADFAAEIGVRTQAIAAVVHFGNGNGDLCAHLRIEDPAVQCAAEVHKAFERGWRMAKHPEQVGDDAEPGLDTFEKLFGPASCLIGIDRCDPVHGVSLSLMTYLLRCTPP